MDHIAIMSRLLGNRGSSIKSGKKDWIEMILSRQKTIESRWYKNKYKPWDSIKKGEIVYFKDSGGPTSVRAEVKKIIQFSELSEKKVKEILYKYGKNIGIDKNDLPKFYKIFKDKKYCILIFLKNPKKIKPFEISKKSFGAMASWITVKDINQIKYKFT